MGSVEGCVDQLKHDVPCVEERYTRCRSLLRRRSFCAAAALSAARMWGIHQCVGGQRRVLAPRFTKVGTRILRRFAISEGITSLKSGIGLIDIHATGTFSLLPKLRSHLITASSLVA